MICVGWVDRSVNPPPAPKSRVGVRWWVSLCSNPPYFLTLTSDEKGGHFVAAPFERLQSIVYESRYPPSTISIVPVM
jgi:hypothetical protein